MRSIPNQILDYLDENRVEYHRIHHRARYTAQEIAAETHTPGVAFAKTVLFKAGRDWAMAVLPAHHSIDLERLARASGGEQARIATEEETRSLIAARCPECETGAVPPLGKLYGIPVYVSGTMRKDDELTFNAGTLEDVIRISFDDYVRVTAPRVADFSRYTEAAPVHERNT